MSDSRDLNDTAVELTVVRVQFHVFGDVFGPRLGHEFVVQVMCKSHEYLVEYLIDSGDGHPEAIGDIAVRYMMSYDMEEAHASQDHLHDFCQRRSGRPVEADGTGSRRRIDRRGSARALANDVVGMGGIVRASDVYLRSM
ncbi:hypothetical protein E4U50_005264 [Claviceps purpurea]|nr:hypothetical protein E4U50_005264 [Claviceps purpurea]